jgi:hypothetical protein
LGKGAFRVGDDFSHKDNIFGLGDVEKFFGKIPTDTTTTSGAKPVNAPTDGDSPLTKELPLASLPANV